MVMEAPPSPQSVGREFVRQYYTLLNKAPTHLHRFYNHQSSFVHGGLDPPNRETSPVIGQKQIHQKIQQLNFRDCHAKITQVDSQATLGNGVVVQVTGELSNAGHPMRRFTQTFVLAAQSPKKYYVHNDIFRYQDEIISDEECDAEGRSEGEEEIVSERAVLPELQQPINQPTIAPYYNPNAAQIPAAMAQALIHHNQPPPQIMNAQPVNGAIHPDDVNIIPGQVPSHVQPVQNQGLGNQMADIQGLVQAPLNVPSNPIEEPQSLEEPIDEHNNENAYDVEQQEMETERDVLVEPASNEPKTYANLLKSGSTVLPYVNPPSQNMAPYQQQTQPMRQASPPLNVSPNQGSAPRQNLNVAAGNRGSSGGQRINQGASPPQQQQQSQRMPNRPDASRNNMGPRNSMNEEFSFEDRRRSQSQNFNDVNQLFLGNLPHMATEDELREIFGEFGAIVDLRVHSKPTNKVVPPGQRAPPNYGFITYESQLGVQNCLQAKPIFYPKDDKNGTLLNVEEKKNNKDRISYGGGGGRPGMDNNRGGGRGDNGNQRRMGGGPGGPNRNSSGGPPAAPGANNRNNSYGNRNNGPPNNRGPNTYNRR